jgi:hypothetical protein
MKPEIQDRFLAAGGFETQSFSVEQSDWRLQLSKLFSV